MRKVFRLVQAALLEWFRSCRRDLPWRRTHDPYAILVSEFMLQQTQVQTVIPYFERFLDRFPTVDSLAEAEEEEVLRHWSGLGYYRRARSLHTAAKIIVRDHKGRMPDSRETMLKLPGVGPYTAGAVLSIAYGKPEPLVDGNVERVLARLFSIETDLASTAGKKEIWGLARKLLPAEAPGEFNQALMELGATLCLPTNPQCLICPARGNCTAFAEGRMDQFPVKTRSTRNELVEEVVLLIRWKAGWLLTNRNNEGLYGGLWQFPWAWKNDDDESCDETLVRFARSLDLDEIAFEKIHTLKHGVTFRTIRSIFFMGTLKGNHMPSHLRASKDEAFRWVDTADLKEEALPGYQKKALVFTSSPAVSPR